MEKIVLNGLKILVLLVISILGGGIIVGVSFPASRTGYEG